MPLSMRLDSSLAASIFLATAVDANSATAQPTDVISIAIASSDRPATDRQRDADRKPAALLAFAGVKPGEKVGDYAAGQGYFTRLFSGVVGTRGHVYATVPAALFQYANIVKGIADIDAYSKGHPNVSVTAASALDAARFPEKLDLSWISQNYHDLKDPFMGPVNMEAFNRAVFAALKPGGVYLVTDHVAKAGSPTDVTDTLHRIEPSVVLREVEAAGFQFVGESTVLANGSDPHDKAVFDPSIRGHTDQFVYKFSKPHSS